MPWDTETSFLDEVGLSCFGPSGRMATLSRVERPGGPTADRTVRLRSRLERGRGLFDVSFSAKPDKPQSPRRRSLPDGQPSRRQGSAQRAARGPGTGEHRVGPTPEAAAVAVGARIIYLSWAQTFGRPPSARLPGMTARVLPFRRR